MSRSKNHGSGLEMFLCYCNVLERERDSEGGGNKGKLGKVPKFFNEVVDAAIWAVEIAPSKIL